MNNQKLAIFEFDGTVIEGNSMFLFFREVSGGAIPYIWGLLSTSGIAMCRALRLLQKDLLPTSHATLSARHDPGGDKCGSAPVFVRA